MSTTDIQVLAQIRRHIPCQLRHNDTWRHGGAVSQATHMTDHHGRDDDPPNGHQDGGRGTTNPCLARSLDDDYGEVCVEGGGDVDGAAIPLKDLKRPPGGSGGGQSNHSVRPAGYVAVPTYTVQEE